MITNVLDYLENAEKQFPDKTAFGDDIQEISYSGLVKAAKEAGTWIASYGYNNQPILAAADHTVECLIIFLGIVYSGNFYVPVDVKQPLARIRAIAEAAAPVLAVVPKVYTEKFTKVVEEDRLLIREDRIYSGIDEKRLRQIRSSKLDTDPLYLMFTSGSTGIPKGVLICHRSVIDLVEQFADTFGFSSDEVFANQAPFDFDVSVKDIYSTLKNGATMYIVPQSMFSIPKRLVPYLNKHKVTTTIWAVSAMEILSSMKVLEKETPRFLRKVMFSGEVMPVKVLNYWRSYLPEAMYVNLYGPTEITCNCTYYILDREFSDREQLPVGQPFRNTEIMLLNENGSEISKGMTGEICVRGTCLAHGYYRNPEASAAAFKQNPRHNNYPDLVYHTGDYGSWNERGELMFAARRDWQIKHMGHRIELAEIERAASALPYIRRCCCQYDEQSRKIIFIYEAEEECDVKIAKELQEYLPKYMCPNRLIWMKRMPMNQRGKTDRVYLKQRFTGGENEIIYQEAVVLGTGTLAFQCAKLLKEKKVNCTVLDTGEQAGKTLERQCLAQGIVYRRRPYDEIRMYLTQVCAPTLVVSAVNPWILPADVLENAYLFAVNCHQALLPAHPGRNAEMWAIYEGDAKTGITWHMISDRVDGGDILIQKEMPLNKTSTAIGVFRKQCYLAAQAFEEILESMLRGKPTLLPQEGRRQKMRYSWERPEDGKLDLDRPFSEISAFLRAYDYGGLSVVGQPYFERDGRRYIFEGYHITDNDFELKNIKEQKKEEAYSWNN
ncbi:MAG: AMP-binding protein [Eubacteriales bacterium]|nr:AMP-binding protein [Eubacteriales bacterium]